MNNKSVVKEEFEKPLIPGETSPKRVDINVLKSRIQDKQRKEYKVNISIFIFFLITLGALGIFLSI